MCPSEKRKRKEEAIGVVISTCVLRREEREKYVVGTSTF